MIRYACCKDVQIDRVYDAFVVGFSDYIIKLEMPKTIFIKRFFGPEGNALEHSFIALDEGKPVGLILGGIKEYEGIKTLRCGTLCIHPEYRGKGVSRKLFDLHRQVATDQGCKQLFLEVIMGNDRAIRFYQNLGYEKIYDIKYYSYQAAGMLEKEMDDLIGVEKIDFHRVKNLLPQLQDIHVNWQNDFDFMEQLEDLAHYGVYQDSALVSALSVSSTGKIYFVWTNPLYRHRGFARGLMVKALREGNLSNLNISFPNNASLEGFVKHHHFKKEEISQYEMYLTF